MKDQEIKEMYLEVLKKLTPEEVNELATLGLMMVSKTARVILNAIEQNKKKTN